MPDTPPRVLISYSHDSPEHEANVLALADRLRADGIDCRLDQYEPWPKEGWTRWMERQIKEADFVLMVCTETYRRRVDSEEEPGKGLGVCWEGRLIRTLFYEAHGKNEKYLPALIAEGDAEHIPTWLRDYPRFQPFDDARYDGLYRHLTKQPVAAMPELGTLRKLTPLARRERHPDFRAAPVWIVPHAPTPFFTGREDTLQKLREELLRSGRVALCGLGGMGKTETARMYVQRHSDAHPYIFWISAASQDELLAGYAAIARELALPLAGDRDSNAVAQAALRWLNSHNNWLLVIDNADEPKVLRGLLPAREMGQLLITMRPLFTGELATKVEIEPLPDEEGAFLLLHRSRILKDGQALASARDEDQKAARDLWNEMGGLPLALDQAGAYIEETKKSPQRYLTLFRQNRKHLLEGFNYDAEHVSVAVTFSLAHELLVKASPAAGDLLRLCAFLAPDAIPEEILDKGASELGDVLGPSVASELIRDEIIRHARRFALLDRHDLDRTLAVHRLVQAVIAETLTDGEKREWANRAVEAVGRAFPIPRSREWREISLKLLPHARICAYWIERWTIVSPGSGRLLHQTGVTLKQRAILDEAEVFFRRAVGVGQACFGACSRQTATAMVSLGSLLVLRGAFTEAAPVVEGAISIVEALQPPDGQLTIECLHAQAELERELGHLPEAEALCRRALVISEGEFGVEALITARSLSNLASVLGDLGNHAEAEQHCRTAYTLHKRLLGPNDSECAGMASNLAVTLAYQRRWAEAEPLAREALSAKRGRLNPTHHDIAISASNLACILDELSQFPEALELHAEALAINEALFAARHPQRGACHNNLGGHYRLRGLHAQAANSYAAALSAWEWSIGPNHPNVATVCENLAFALRRMGRRKEARPYEVRARKIREQHARENAAPTSPDVAPNSGPEPETEA